jgi:hypothetical protein
MQVREGSAGSRSVGKRANPPGIDGARYCRLVAGVLSDVVLIEHRRVASGQDILHVGRSQGFRAIHAAAQWRCAPMRCPDHV